MVYGLCFLTWWKFPNSATDLAGVGELHRNTCTQGNYFNFNAFLTPEWLFNWILKKKNYLLLRIFLKLDTVTLLKLSKKH
jgi:hypothetical protein